MPRCLRKAPRWHRPHVELCEDPQLAFTWQYARAALKGQKLSTQIPPRLILLSLNAKLHELENSNELEVREAPLQDQSQLCAAPDLFGLGERGAC